MGEPSKGFALYSRARAHLLVRLYKHVEHITVRADPVGSDRLYRERAGPRQGAGAQPRYQLRTVRRHRYDLHLLAVDQNNRAGNEPRAAHDDLEFLRLLLDHDGLEQVSRRP